MKFHNFIISSFTLLILNANPAVTDGTEDIFIACTRKKGTETELVFRINNDGSLFFKHNFGDVTQHAKLASSIVTADSSVYVGSCRLSYDRAAHLLEMRRLKLNHVPLYLQGRGFTAADLPSTHVQNDMSVRKWLVHARTHFGEEELDVRDVFPPDSDDWVPIDAPVSALKADVVTLQGQAVELTAWAEGADADIEALETEVDVAQAKLIELEARIVVLEG